MAGGLPVNQHILLSREVAPDQVHDMLGRHVLADGFRLVYDTRASRGSWVVDARSGEKYLDLYTFFASAPLGSNPRGLADDPDFMAVLAEVAANKPANPDMYTTHYAQFVETFARVLGDPALPHLFFVEGGALAVENALKTAFDWKSRANEAAGRPGGLGTRVLHLTRAFHGRSGYTLSLTNTEPGKTARFPKFDWPRIDVPAVRFQVRVHREPDRGPVDPRPVELREPGGLARLGVGQRQGVPGPAVEGAGEVQDPGSQPRRAAGRLVGAALPVERGLQRVLDGQRPALDEEQVRQRRIAEHPRERLHELRVVRRVHVGVRGLVRRRLGQLGHELRVV